MEIFLNIFFLVWVFVTFWYCHYLVNFVCGEILASRLWKSLLFYLTLVVRLFHESFARVLLLFEYHFNSLLLTFINGVLALFSRVLQKPTIWILSKFNSMVVCWIVVNSTNSEQVTKILRLLRLLNFFFFGLLVLYFYIVPSRVYFEYVSCKVFRWYLLFLIGLLTCL